MGKRRTGWKQGPEREFLKLPPIHALQSTLKDLDDNFRLFFRKEGGYPKFKRQNVKFSWIVEVGRHWVFKPIFHTMIRRHFKFRNKKIKKLASYLRF